MSEKALKRKTEEKNHRKTMCLVIRESSILTVHFIMITVSECNGSICFLYAYESNAMCLESKITYQFQLNGWKHKVQLLSKSITLNRNEEKKIIR